MKRGYITLVGLVLCLAQMWATPRTVEQALEVALQIDGQQAAARMAAGEQAMTLAGVVRTEAGEPAAYVFNRGEEKGFVMIAADDQAYTVLGYSDTGRWDETDLPAGLQAWANMYAEQIAQLSGHASSPTEGTARTYTPVAPICQTQWGQRAPFNLMCPTWNGANCLTGCVATAASQVMNVHKYPSQGQGANSYKWANENKDSVTLSADFQTTTYAWDATMDTAKLVYHCGVSCNMKYGPTNSSAKSFKMMQALVNHFRYDKGIQRLYLDFMPADELVDSIAADLQQGRPVYFSAKTVRNEGHAFVCDGIDADGLLHINWGWYGKSDGYFRLTALNPKSQGDGGSATNAGYTTNVQVYTHIRPDANGDYYYSFGCENIRVVSDRVVKTEKVQFRVDTLRNFSLAPWTGHLSLNVYKDGAFYANRNIQQSMAELGADRYRTIVSYNANFSSYPAGNYEVEMMARVESMPGKLFPVMRRNHGHWRCQMTITEDSIFITLPVITEPEHPEVVDPADYEFTKLVAYYYPNTSEDAYHQWKLQLSTDGFYSKDANADEDQMLLLFNVFGWSSNAIVGNYPAGAKTGHNCWKGIHYYGVAAAQDEMITTEASSAACTLWYDAESNAYRMTYQMRLYNEDYSGSAAITLENIRAYYGEATDGHAKGERITLVHPTPIIREPADEAQPRKVLENGQLFILLPDGKKYTVTGNRIR